MPTTSFLSHPRIITRDFTVHRLVRTGARVTRDHDGTWVVHQRDAVRAVSARGLAALESPDFENLLRELGVDTELELAGAHPGDLVRIGRLEFELNGRRPPGYGAT